MASRVGHQGHDGGDYALGWLVAERDWGGPAASKACDEAASKRIRLHLGE